MKPVRILVRDSYHTPRIAATLRQQLGDKVICYEESLPQDGTKIDIFFLSGRDVLCGGVLIPRLKAQSGSEKSKVVVTSAMDEYLLEIQARPELGADFTVHKGKLVDGLLGGNGGSGSIETFLSTVLASVS